MPANDTMVESKASYVCGVLAMTMSKAMSKTNVPFIVESLRVKSILPLIRLPYVQGRSPDCRIYLVASLACFEPGSGTVCSADAVCHSVPFALWLYGLQLVLVIRSYILRFLLVLLW